MSNYIAVVYTPKSGTLRILKIVPQEGLVAKDLLRDTAVKFVYDSVGKNNYIETLDDPREYTEFPQGLVLKYQFDDVSGAPNTIKINMYKNTQHEAGWVRSCLETVSEELGVFSYVFVEDFNNIYACMYEFAEAERVELKKKVLELSREVELLREDAKYAVRTHSTPRVNLARNDVQDRTIELIKNFDMSTLRKVGGELLDLPEYVSDDSGYESDSGYAYCDDNYEDSDCD